MASISFSFLLYAAYSVTLCVLLPIDRTSTPGHPPLIPLHFDPASRSSRRVLVSTALFFALLDMVIDPLALRGDRWFLGSIYLYADPGIHFGVPLTNYLWMGRGRVDFPLHPIFASTADSLTSHITPTGPPRIGSFRVWGSTMPCWPLTLA